jgi:hypothetical protein
MDSVLKMTLENEGSKNNAQTSLPGAFDMNLTSASR